jgi:DNA-binding Lrp family transcriptional regulator
MKVDIMGRKRNAESRWDVAERQMAEVLELLRDGSLSKIEVARKLEISPSKVTFLARGLHNSQYKKKFLFLMNSSAYDLIAPILIERNLKKERANVKELSDRMSLKHGVKVIVPAMGIWIEERIDIKELSELMSVKYEFKITASLIKKMIAREKEKGDTNRDFTLEIEKKSRIYLKPKQPTNLMRISKSGPR